MSRAYYNEIDQHAAQWLRNLITAGHIAPGDVDERSIEDVRPTDLLGYTQCHFFAGIGIWSYALRQAGWPDDRPVWTGSCPCQPFSTAGKGKGLADERHLWPAWFHLIEQAKPGGTPVFGEQVANGDGLAWLDLVWADMEGAGYAFRALDLCAAGFGAPHIRQRLFFHAACGLADAGHDELGGRDAIRCAEGEHGCAPCEGEGTGAERQRPEHDTPVRGSGGGVADTEHIGHRGSEADASEQGGNGTGNRLLDGSVGGLRDTRPGPVNGRWAAADWLWCRDQKWRPVEPGTFPLVDGAPSRVVRLRAYGNGIVSEVATEFIKAVMP